MNYSLCDKTNQLQNNPKFPTDRIRSLTSLNSRHHDLRASRSRNYTRPVMLPLAVCSVDGEATNSCCCFRIDGGS